MSSKNLHKARKEKNDEFNTELSDIEKEIARYSKDQFKDKVVLCNCNDSPDSNFFRYFFYRFKKLRLKKLIGISYFDKIMKFDSTTSLNNAEVFEFNGSKERMPNPKDITVTPLKEFGEFSSEECIDILKQADIVLTNPPFSLFVEYMALLFKYKKKFLIMGKTDKVMITGVWENFKEGNVWPGYNYNINCNFIIPSHYKKYNKIVDGIKYGEVSGIMWFTNLIHIKMNNPLVLVKKYYGNEEDYPKYDNIDAIEVSKVKHIPKDYYGVMGVPITFIGSWNPNQFEIVGGEKLNTFINGKETYRRILIKRKERK